MTGLTPAEAGELMGLRAEKVRELIQRGELPRTYNKAGRGYGTRYVIDPRDVEQWKQARRIVA